MTQVRPPIHGAPDYQTGAMVLSTQFTTAVAQPAPGGSSVETFDAYNWPYLDVEVGNFDAAFRCEVNMVSLADFGGLQAGFVHDVPASQLLAVKLPLIADSAAIQLYQAVATGHFVTVNAWNTTRSGPRYWNLSTLPMLGVTAKSVAGGATDTLNQRYPYAGPALWAIRGPATVWHATLIGRDYLGNDTFVASADSTVDGVAFRQTVLLPPLILRTEFVNADVGAQTYSAGLIADLTRGN